MPIAEHDDNWFNTEWPNTVFKWVKMLGIRTKDGTNVLPDEIQERFLIDFLVNEYGALTFEEIELAFRMNMLGELGPVIEHYNELNIKFLSQIVNAYKSRRVEIDQKYKQICHKMEYLPAPVEDPKLADYYSGKHTYLKYKNWLQGLPVIALHLDYRFLLRIGILTEDPAAMQEALTMAQAGIEHDVDTALVDRQQLGAVLTNDKLLMQNIEDHAKAYLVQELFEKLKSDGADFQALIRSHIAHTHGRESNT